jgi:RHS repeat-associated protein
VSRPNGVSTTYGYDAAGNTAGISDTGPGGPIASYTYGYDAAENRTSVATSAGTESYTLDKLGRLTKASYPNGDVVSYTYDAAGNRTSVTVNGATTTAVYNADNELTSNGGTTYSYDGAGNLTTAGSNAYIWDSAGDLTSSNVGGTASTYAYNGDGLRASATTGGSTTPYLWNSQGGVPTLVNDGPNTYLQSQGGVQEQVGSSDNTTYPLADTLGSIRTITDSTGSVVGTASYDAYGAVRSSSGASSIFGFAGQQTDLTGLQYLRARYYDPTIGDFLSADSVQPSAPGTQGYNRYIYGGDSPTTQMDPTGHEALPDEAPIYKNTTDRISILRALGTYLFKRILVPLLIRLYLVLTSGIIAILITSGLVAFLIQELLPEIVDPPYKKPLPSGIPIYYSGSFYGSTLMPFTTQHVADALNSGQPDQLNYRPNYLSPPGSRAWYNVKKYNDVGQHPDYQECNSNPGVLTCDEYPFYSSSQGFDGSSTYRNRDSLRLVPTEENNAQGPSLGNFVQGCGLAPGNPFGVDTTSGKTHGTDAGGNTCS